MFATLITLSSIPSYLRRKPGPADSIHLDEQCVPMNTFRMLITPKAIQDLLDELEASKQSRLRAWKALQRLRSIFSELGNVAIPVPTQKTFERKERSWSML